MRILQPNFVNFVIMDEIVYYFDTIVLSPVFSTLETCVPDFFEHLISPNSLLRQLICLYVIIAGGGVVLYFALSSLSYLIFFKLLKDKYYPEDAPQPFKGQVQLEIKLSLKSIPTIAHLTVPFFLGEINGYSKLYGNVDDYGAPYLLGSFLAFLIWSDTLIYWIHRELHDVPWLYKKLHKAHHRWKVPTPFAAIAFHPVDGWLQSLPYHVFPYCFPMHKWLSLASFAFVQIWAVLIHDGVHFTPLKFVNGSAHHTFHHSKFTYNYGQFFTFWDQLCKTHMDPFNRFDKTTKNWTKQNSKSK